ncbi:hypothetical protein BWD09_04255 [Neisseria dentiae]|uniref:Uncharacterized protein n=1 Tax=Neisseria dentiae TaxID=194197 RepID=A0A1X3DE33_9NEIS|nr:hypothetical protein [Neisseria dentiae]OSI17971.1 hypothetical protein BWD09_04255 [Neisseria dentiae]QMT45108.1 hypothetical protein H3L92_12025 [Neisseria dentiae]STZ50863.1 Uncharacterised protein [Neisseria dentiae]
MKTLNKVLLAGGVIAALSLTQCDLVTTATSELLFPPKLVDFPLGEGKTISYPLTSWIEKPYGINIKIEYIENKWGKKIPDMPYRFSVKCYRLEKNAEVLFFEDIYIIRDISYQVDNETYIRHENILDGGRGWAPNNPNNPDADGRSHQLKAFRLPYGRYRCDFKDESPSEIKAMLKEAGIVRTAIDIFPYTLIFY